MDASLIDEHDATLASQFNMHTLHMRLLDTIPSPLEDKKAAAQRRAEVEVCSLIRHARESEALMLVKKCRLYDSTITLSRNLVLSVAANHGHFGLVSQLLKSFESIEDRNNGNLRVNLLKAAVRFDEIGFIRDYVTTYPEQWPTVRHDNHFTVLAAQTGSAKCLRYFLEQRKYNAKGMQTLLTLSIEHSQLKSLKVLFETTRDKVFSDNQAKLKINQALAGQTALHLAIKHGSRDSLELLLSQGADVRALNKKNQTVFHLAIEYDDAYLLKRLFKLTRPTDWPQNLREINQDACSSEVRQVLSKHIKRLPKTLTDVAQQPIILAKKTSSYPLHEAIVQRQSEKAQGLINAKTINERNAKRQTPLMLAAATGNTAIMDKLVAKGAMLTAVDRNGYTALLYAIESQQIEAALWLWPLVHGDNCVDRRGVSALMLAAAFGMMPVVAAYCSQADHTRDVDRKGMNALHHAASNNQKGIVAYLIEQGFAVDTVIHAPKKRRHAQTALHIAANLGHTETVKVLLNLGASPTQVDAQGFGLVEHAVFSKQAEMLLIIRQLPHYYHRATHPSLLRAVVLSDQHEVMMELILAHADLSITDKQGLTLVHLAAIANAVKVMACLIESHEISLNQCDKAQNTALHYAGEHGHVAMIEQLAEQGVELDTLNDDKLTPLYLSCAGGHLGAMLSLYKWGADVAFQAPNGLSLAQVALSHGHIDIACRLVQWGDAVSCTHASIVALADNGLRDNLLQHEAAFQEALKRQIAKPQLIQARRQFGLYKTHPIIANPYAQHLTEPHALPVLKEKDIEPILDGLALCTSHLAKLQAYQLSPGEKVKVQSVVEECIKNQHSTHDIAQFISLAVQIRQLAGQYLLDQVLSTPPGKKYVLREYLTAFNQVIELLADKRLYRITGAFTHPENRTNLALSGRIFLHQFVPSGFFDLLQHLYDLHCEETFPAQNIEATLVRFAACEFPLPADELAEIKVQYLEVMPHLQHLRALPQAAIAARAAELFCELPHQDGIYFNAPL